jgi:hypothetical protein
MCKLPWAVQGSQSVTGKHSVRRSLSCSGSLFSYTRVLWHHYANHVLFLIQIRRTTRVSGREKAVGRGPSMMGKKSRTDAVGTVRYNSLSSITGTHRIAYEDPLQNINAYVYKIRSD